MIFSKADNSGFMLLMHRFEDGHLVPAELTETWTPTDKWVLSIEEPIVDAEFVGDRPEDADIPPETGSPT